MEDEEGRAAGLADTGHPRDLLERVLEDRDQHRRRERGDGIGQHLADVGARQPLDAGVEHGLAVDGDGTRLQQDGAVRADGPFDVLGIAEERLRPPGQIHHGPQLVLFDRDAVAARRRPPRAGGAVQDFAPRSDEAGDQSLAPTGVRLHDQHGRVARIAREHDPRLARLDELLDEDGDDRRRGGGAQEAGVIFGDRASAATHGLGDPRGAAHVELRTELPGEARLRGILGRGRGAHRDRAQTPAGLLQRVRIGLRPVPRHHEPVRHGQAGAAHPRERPRLASRALAIVGGERVEPEERPHHGRVSSSQRTSTVTKASVRWAACGRRILNRCQVQAAP